MPRALTHPGSLRLKASLFKYELTMHASTSRSNTGFAFSGNMAPCSGPWVPKTLEVGKSVRMDAAESKWLCG